MSRLADLIFKRLGRWLGGVPPHMRLSQERMDEMKPLIARASRAIFLPIMLLIAPLTAVLKFAIAWLLKFREPAPVAPILDARTRVIWVATAIFCFFTLVLAGAWFEHKLIRRRLGLHAADYDRYNATKSNWLPRRQLIITSLLGSLMLAFFGLYILYGGDRIDQTGIAHPTGLWARAHHPYSAVTSVETYTSLRAPIGIVNRPSLRVRFSDGAVYNRVSRFNASPSVGDLAAFISDRSGVPVTSETRRP